MAQVSKGAKHRLVPRYVIAILILIAIVAIVAKGPPQIYLYVGPTPLNQGALGTSQLLILLRHYYPFTFVAMSMSDVARYAKGSHCLYVVISPQVPISMEEARQIVKYLKECSRYAVLIADESRNSNELIRVLGGPMRVESSIVLDLETKSPYPTATFIVSNNSYRLRLDIASSISGCPKVIGFVSNALVLYPNKTFSVAKRICVGALYRSGSLTLVVIGDGSIFLNQVIESSYGLEYQKFILSLVSYLCGNDHSCHIIIDGYHYLKLSPIQVLRNPMLAKYVDPFTLVPALIAYLIHPATWLPPVLKIANDAIFYALSSYGLSIVTTLCLALIAYGIARRLVGSGTEYRLAPQLEQGSVFSLGLHDAIARGRYSFSKEDFIRLYSLVNEALQSIAGISLADKDCVSVLSSYVGREKAEKFVKEMNRYLLKAKGERFLPIVISWNRLIKRMIREAEEVLNAIGTSIAEKRGVLRV